MKTCVVSTNNISMTPYFSVYKKILKSYDIIYWNRNDDKEILEAENVFEFSDKGQNKNVSYIKFLFYVVRILNSQCYDRVVFLHSQVGIAIYPLIFRKYRGKYICDIRDYEYENYWIYRKLEKFFTNNSIVNIISSPGYKQFLPKSEYHILHNDRLVEKKYIAAHDEKKQGGKLVIGNIGLIRFHEQNKRLLLKLKNDDRFELRFIGTGANELREFCSDNQIENVVIKDYFKANETMKYFSECDMVFNLYGNHTPHLDYALSNKLYIAARFAMPILVCPDTYMEKVSVENGFGIVVDLNQDDVGSNIYEQYKKLMNSNIKNSCNTFIEKIEKENETTLEVMKTQFL